MKKLVICSLGIFFLMIHSLKAQPGIMVQFIELDTLSKRASAKIKDDMGSYIHYVIKIDSNTNLDHISYLEAWEYLQLEIDLVSVPERFRSFDMSHCKSLSLSGNHRRLKELSALDAFTNLERLNLMHFAGEALPASILALNKLSSLYVGYAPYLQELEVLGALPNLEQLVLNDVPALGRIPDLSPANRIQVLSVNLSADCTMEALGSAKNLQILNIQGSALVSFPDKAFSKLKVVQLSNCNKLQSISGLANSVHIEKITLHHTKIKEINGDFSGLQLRRFEIRDNPLLASTSGLSSLDKVDELLINNSPNLVALGTAVWEAKIKKIYLTDLPKLTDIGPIIGLSDLRDLYLSHTAIEALPEYFSRLDDLNILYLDDNFNLRDIGELSHMKSLHHLDISNSPLIKEIPPSFATNQTLQSAKFDLSGLEGISGLVGLSQLSSLSLKFEQESFSLPVDIYQTYHLSSLTLEGPIKDLSPLLSLASLSAIILVGDQLSKWPQDFYPSYIKISQTNISDLSDLDCTKVSNLNLMYNPNLKRVPNRESLDKISHLVIRRNPNLKITPHQKNYHWIISENDDQ